MKEEDYNPSEKDFENIKRLESYIQDKDVTIGLLKDDVKRQGRQINELGLLVHRLCKMIEYNFTEGKPLDIKKAEEASNYIIKNFQIKNILR